ncbi:MAG: putative transporter ATP-binding protein [Francisellaceae bacterium]|nr:putative transporter ATP-binding protein [Francisellaceae bacterium]
MTKLIDSLIEIKDLTFTRNERFIFKKVNLKVQEGKITAIMGPSGTGKTTLLKIIGGQITPNAGTVEVNGKNIAQLNRHELYKARRSMGMLFQSGALFSDLSVFENVAFPIREHTNLNESMIQDLVFMKLEAVGLRGAHALMPSELSGGMARRAALARAIALDPRLIMFDEPFAGQDPITMGVLVQLIKRLNQSLGMTTLLVSHDVKETVSIADYIYLLAGGEVIGSGTPQELMNSENPWVKQFMHGLPDGPVAYHFPAINYQEALLGKRNENNN